MNPPPDNTHETNETRESLEASLVIIGQIIASPAFAQKLRERIGKTDLDLEYRLHVKRHAGGYGVFFSFRRKSPLRSIMSFGHVE